MAAAPQPAKKSYFFDKGYKDLWSTITEAWSFNLNTVNDFFSKFKNVSSSGRNAIVKGFLYVAYILAVISVLVVGSIVTLLISAINIVILLVFMALVYVGFTLIWLIDRLYLMKNKIFTACHECKEKSLIPTYLCPNCGVKHTNLTPGVYGILKRRCNCGEKIPTTFFNGRKELEAECPLCGNKLMDRESVPICIPVVGGRSVGKTAFITAFTRDFREKIAPINSWKIKKYNSVKESIYTEIINDYNHGSTRMTRRSSNINQASSVSVSFFVEGSSFNPERLVHVYDIAGEVFTNNDENELQKQYEYCHGIVFIVDPFSIPSVRNRYEALLSPEDLAGIGKADINGIIFSFLNKIRQVTGLSETKMMQVPIAVVISKVDSAGLSKKIGKGAINQLCRDNPSKFSNYFEAEDYLCRKYLIENGMAGFVKNISLKFKNNRFFACSAIGHTRDKGSYDPEGVMEPMEWLFQNADSKMKSSWTDHTFAKTPIAVAEKML